jgi:glutamyl/glutaminyl-tRNA synthetase
MGITHVVRGEDHLSNTPRQILLYEALGFTPPTFAHLAMVLVPDHSPLSKRHGATSVEEFRAKGYLPEALDNYLALIGWSPRGAASAKSGGDAELLPLDELAKRFSLDDVVSTAGVFDEEKLAWVNRHYLKVANVKRLADLAVEHFRNAGVTMAPDARGLRFLESVLPIASSSVDRLNQVPARLSFLFDYSPDRTLADQQVLDEMRTPEALAVVRALAEELQSVPRLVDRDRFRSAANAVKAKTGQKSRMLFHPIRIALTGRAEGPELDLAIPGIDRGADLPRDAGIPPITGCRERAVAFADALAHRAAVRES